MKDMVKKIINYRYDRYQNTERKLEKLVARGLFLKDCGSYFWTFQKGEPKRLKYTVTCFPEGSVFNPYVTDNQQTYLDLAKAAGWSFVAQLNQLQIFSSEMENPIPFETDEQEKYNNIKKCMNRNFLPSMIVLILLFALNLVLQLNSLKSDPIDFLSSSNQLVSVFMMMMVMLYELYSVIDYFIWCKRAEKTIACGGKCSDLKGTAQKIVDFIFMSIIIFGSIGYLLFCLNFEISWFGLMMCIIQMPILLFIFWSSIQYLKKKRASALINKLISFTVLILANFGYLAMMMLLILKFGFTTSVDSEYRTVSWQINATSSHEYKLYNDAIPLTCEDLYGTIAYDYYSYEKEIDNTIFLAKSSYRQESLPAKDAPPEIAYEILEPKFKFVYHLAKKQLLEIPTWREYMSFKALENNIFGTAEAYQKYYDNEPTGDYILFFEDKIMTLAMEVPVTTEQVYTIKEKLNI